MTNKELKIALQNIEIEYYRRSSNFDNYTLEEFTLMMLEEYYGV